MNIIQLCPAITYFNEYKKKSKTQVYRIYTVRDTFYDMNLPTRIQFKYPILTNTY